MLAPIVIFLFDKPDHTRLVLNSLNENELANQSILHIYCDGPKEGSSTEQLDRINKVKSIAEEKLWCKEVIIVHREKNLGLAASITQGISEILSKFEKIIVLEDDILVSKGFLKFMNEALEYYNIHDQVMQISGYWIPPHFGIVQPENFFFQVPTCWGWGTWRRSWEHYNDDAVELSEKILEKDGSFDRFNFQLGDYERQLKLNISHPNSTWAVKWYASLYLVDGLCLHPGTSLVQNIGNDGTGVNSAITNCFQWPEIADRISVQKDILIEKADSAYLEMHLFFKCFFSREMGFIEKLNWKIRKYFKFF